MYNLQVIDKRVDQMLNSFSNQKIYSYFIPFLNEKHSLQDKLFLRKKLIEKIKNHQEFKKNYCKKTEFNWNNFLTCDKKPSSSFISLSISYSHHLGAFVYSFDNNYSIGLDIEKPYRITKKITDRISSKEERHQVPFVPLLWVAKEASLKSLYKKKVTYLLNHCKIFNWNTKKDMYFFDFKSTVNEQRGKGVAILTKELTIAYSQCAK